MSTQPSASSRNRYRYHIKRIEIRPAQTVNGKIWAEIQVDGVIVHALSPIKKGQSLVWDGPFHCDLRPDSLIIFLIRGVEESLFKHKRTFRCIIGVHTSDISNELPVCSIERSSDALSVSFTFLNPPSVLNPDTIHGAFETILNFGTSVFELCPAVAHTALSSCQATCDRLRDDIEYSRDIEELAIGFADTLRPIPSVIGDTDTRDLMDTTAGILDLIQMASALVLNYISMTETDRGESTFVLSCRSTVQIFLEQLGQLKHDFDQQLREEITYLARVDEAVDRLKPIAHSTHHNNRECLPDTRIMLMGDIHEWIERETGLDRLLWIHGPSGSGKSAIATSVCRSLEARNLLCASSFCKWDDPELCEPESVIKSIVYGLAKHHTGYRKQASSAIHYYLELPDLWFRLFYERLVTIPLMAATNQATEVESTCIVIDALDQCKDSQTRRGLLSYLFHLSQNAPWLKVIVTSCPNQDIQDFFDSVSEASIGRMDVCKYDASNDISVFIRNRMSSGPSNPFRLDDSHVSSLAGSAGGLFIWTDMVCKIISDEPNPHQRLAEILKSSAVANPYLQLDRLYSMVLKEYVPDMSKEHASRTWLGAIVATAPSLHAPPPIDTLEQLLGEPLHSGGLAAVQNVVHVMYEGHSHHGDGVVRAYHRSFINYITTQSRSKDFYIDPTKQNAIFSTRCLSTMLNELKFNISGLETSYTRNSDVPDLGSRVSSAIGPHLSYSCLWWIDHVIRVDPMYVDMALLREFLFGRTIFYWIEALSLMNKLDIAVLKLPKFVVWTRASPDLIEFAEGAGDVYRFVTTFYDAISESAPHLYLSAIAFAPSNSGMAKRGREWFPNTPSLMHGASQLWAPRLHILPHAGVVPCLAFSPDGRTIATGCDDHTVRLWDIAVSPRLIARLIGHSDWVWSVAFSPNGGHIASGSHDKTVRVWDAKTGDKILEPVMGHSSPVLSVAFSHDGRHIVSGSHDKTVRMWDVETGAMACAPLVGHSGPVLAVAYSPNNRYIASGSFDKTVRIWDLKSGESVLLTGHSGWVRAVAFSPDGRRIVSGSSDRTIRIWDASSRVYVPIVGHSGMVNCVAFSPDGRYIISGSSDTTERVWDPDTGAQLFAPLVGHSDHVLSVAFSCDGGRILSCSSDHTVRIWDVQTMTGKESHVLSIGNPGSRPSDLPKDHRTAPDSDDKAMQIWKEEPGAEVVVSLVGHSDWVNSVAFSPDGRRIVSGSDDTTLRIWDATTGAEVSPPVVGHSSLVFSVAFSPNSRRIVSGSYEKTVRIWDAGTGTRLFASLVGHSGGVRSVAFSPDGRRIASGSDDRTVRRWNAKTGSQLPAPLTGHSGGVNSVAFSPDSRRIVSGSDDNMVRIWDVKTGAEVFAPLVGHSNRVWSVAFSPDGSRIVSGSDDQTVRIWNAETGAEVTAPLVGHSAWVRSVAFSPDGRFIVSGSWDKTVRMWDAETGTQVSAPLVGHSGGVTSVAFSPDGRRIVSGSADKTVRIWDVVHHLVTAGVPLNSSYLLPFIEPTGWVSLPGKPCWLWIPSELRTPTVEAESTPNSSETSPPSSRVVIDVSRFVHGRRWTSVAAD